MSQLYLDADCQKPARKQTDSRYYHAFLLVLVIPALAATADAQQPPADQPSPADKRMARSVSWS